MWRFGSVMAFAAMALLPRVASATVYDFNATETSALSPSPVTFTFALNTAAATANAGITDFNNVTITENGTAMPGNAIAAQYGTTLGSALFYFIDTSSQPFYSGAGSAITFNPGTFAIADGATDGEGTLTISGGATAPTPEPATWSLLLTGCATAASARRFFRRSSSTDRTAA